jgi:hypothetical protein
MQKLRSKYGIDIVKSAFELKEWNILEEKTSKIF